MIATTYHEADALVMAALANWRRKTPPYSQDEVVECPACAGRLRLQQIIYNMKDQRTRVSATCQTAFCVNYRE